MGKCRPPIPYTAMEVQDALGLPPSQWVDVGGPVHYREWPGPGTGPTFVLVHGLGGSHLNWAGVAPGLARRGRVLALDLAGFGLTPPEGRGTDVGSNWRVLGGFLAALELAPAILVGNSMGGMLAMIQCAHAPRTVEAMVLVDAAFPRARTVSSQPSPRVAALFAIYASPRVGGWFASARVRRLGAEGLVRETLRVCAADPSRLDPALVAAHVELARLRLGFDYGTRAFLDAARSIFRAEVAPGRYRAVVRAARRPALVMHGARDQLVPVAAAEIAVRDHPDWELVVFDDLGHIPQMEAPDRWLQAVERWLDRRAGRTEEEEAI
jgi:pimeloyl-ACP methyl ester carboxylesterase